METLPLPLCSRSSVTIKNCSFRPSALCSGLTPPKRSRGKPALSRVPFLEGVNGDSDHSGSGEEVMEAELGKQVLRSELPSVPCGAHNLAASL